MCITTCKRCVQAVHPITFNFKMGAFTCQFWLATQSSHPKVWYMWPQTCGCHVAVIGHSHCWSEGREGSSERLGQALFPSGVNVVLRAPWWCLPTPPLNHYGCPSPISPSPNKLQITLGPCQCCVHQLWYSPKLITSIQMATPATQASYFHASKVHSVRQSSP